MPVSVGELMAYLRLDSGQFNTGVRAAQEQMTRATGSASRFTGAVAESGAALSGAGRMAGVASAGTAKLRAAQLSAVAATARYNAELNRTDASVARLASTEAAAIRANERLAAAMAGPAAAAARLNASTAATPGLMARSAAGFASAGRAALGLGAAFGAFEIIKKSIDITKEANEFHRSMVQVQTTADVSATEVNKASSALLAMAGPVAAAPTELATAWYHAKSVGLDYAKSLETTKIAAEGARVGHANLEETMNALTSTVASGIPGVTDMGSAMGKLIAIVGTGDMKLSDLNSALGSGLLTVVKGYGLSLTDVGAALATFGDNNIRGANAATMLRMAVQAMAVPAKAGSALIGELGLTSEGSAAALAKVHLSTSALAKDMQTGGLNKAILDLKKHLDNAGVSGVQTGQVLTEVFGKRAGPGIAVLVGQVDRLESKFKILDSAGSSFGDKWKATTQTASFALARLGHTVEAAGIAFTAKLGPSIAAAATMITTTLPHALGTLQNALSPLEHVVGGTLVVAWTAFAAVLRTSAGALGQIGGFLKNNRALVTELGTAVLALWGTFKLAALAAAGLRMIGPALTRIGVAAEGARAKMAALSTTQVAMGALAVGVGLVTAAWQINSQRAAQAKALVDEYTQALQQSNGAVDESIRKMVTQKLASEGVYDAARKYHVSLDDVTASALGNADATARIAKALNGNYEGLEKVTGGTLRQNGALDAATRHYKDAATQVGHLVSGTGKHAAAVAADTRVLQYSIDAHGNLVTSMAKAGSSLDNTSAAMQRQTIASGLLKNAIDILNGVNVSVEQAQDALTISLGNLTNKTTLFKDVNGKVSRSLDQSTVAGATNRQMLVGIIEQAKGAAQAVADHARQQGKSLPAALLLGNNALATNEAKIRAAAKAAGMSAPEVDKLIASIGQLAHIKADPKIDADPSVAAAKIKGIRQQMSAIRQGHVPGVDANTAPGKAKLAALQRQIDSLQNQQITIGIAVRNDVGAAVHNAVNSLNPGRASGGGAPEGYFSVGEQGPEIAHKQGNRVDIMSNSQSKSFIAQTGMRFPGFAKGTSAASAAASSAVSSAVGNIGSTYTPPFDIAGNGGMARIKAQIAAAVRVLNIELNKGLSSGAAATFRRQLHAMVALAQHELANLKVTITGHDLAAFTKQLKGTVDDARAAFATLLSDVKKAGVSTRFAATLQSEDTRLVAAIAKRTSLTNKLTNDAAKLADAKQKYADEIASIKSAVTGSFDVTTAGTGFDGNQPITGSSILAQANQAATRARLFVNDIKKLKGKLNATYLRQLAEKGPDALPEAQALLTLSAADMKTLNADATSLSSSGGILGKFEAGNVYGGEIAADQKAVDRDKAMIAATQATIDHLGQVMAAQVRAGMLAVHFDLNVDSRKIATAVATGTNKNARRS